MVVRPPIETWSRVELEEHFHNVYQQLQASQKKINEQDKKLTVLNTRLRRSVIERKAKQDAYVEREKFEDVQRENQVLALKLKTVKHQLLTYTTPTARPATASAMTGRSTFRPQPTRRQPAIATTDAEKTDRRESKADNSDGNRTSTVRISEAALKDKASYIRLNRLVREKNSQVAELQYETERLNGLLHELRTQLEAKTSSVEELESELRTLREHADDAQYLGKIELITKQLTVAQAENEVLKEANERLVKQSLSMEFDESLKELIELKKQIPIFEERLKQAEHRRIKAEERLKKEKRALKHLRDKERSKKGFATYQKERTRSEDSLEESEETSAKEESRKRKRKKGGKDDDILERLYRDVSAILETHESYEDGVIDISGSLPEKLARWKKMYASLYDELEKLRNMLLVQHEINQKQNSEISLLQEEMESIKVKYESKLKELRDKLIEKQKKILLLEEQIRSIAYGTQKPIPLKASDDKAELSTDLSIMFTSVSLTDEYVAAVGACPAYFLSLEFFDFELQTTPILVKQTGAMNFTTIYNVVVSSLFVHYIETNGITIELYSPQGTNYTLLAAGVVNLKPLIQKGAKSRYVGELKLVSLDSGLTVAKLKYELNTTEELAKSIDSYQVAEAAQKVLPIDIPLEQSFEELTVIVNRCTGLENLKRGQLEVCIIYEFFSFSPYFTNYATSSKTAEFNSRRDWSLPTEAVQSHLAETEISFFLFENRPNAREDKDGVLAMLSLPMAPLAENKPIKGSFMMTRADGKDSGVYLDVSVVWKYGLGQVRAKPAAKPLTSGHAAGSKPVQEDAPVISKSFAQHQESVDIIRNGSSSSDEIYSPVSLVGSKIPSVTEILQKDDDSSKRQGIETVSLKSSPKSSDSLLANGAASKEDEQECRSSSSSVHSHRMDVEANSLSSPESQESVVASSERPSSSILDENAASRQTSEVVPAESKLEKDKDEIRSLLGNLPPIAKPRYSKPPSEFSSLTALGRPKQESEESSKSKTSSENDELEDRHRLVFFTDPLHKSIPPSETSSVSSPPPKPPVRLPARGGRSAMRVTNVEQEGDESSISSDIKEDSEADESRVVSIFIDRIYVPDFSRLLHPTFDGVRVYIDWFFLDYPLEDSRTPQAIPIPRLPDTPGVFAYKKEFQLSKRRVALLEQWLELGNRLDFTLITEGEDSEELAVAQLELSRAATDETTTIQFLDINGEHYADLDLIVSYSPQIFDCLKS